QTNQIAKIVGDIEKVIEHSNELTAGYNMIMNFRISETTYLEKVINLFRKDMFNVLVELDHESDEFQVLDDVTMTLKNVLDDVRDVYEFTVITGDSVTQQETNRKGYLLSMLEWSLNELQGNIEMEVI
ncbi:pathogenicity island protein, partial [Mammaliicoccus vitulinus]